MNTEHLGPVCSKMSHEHVNPRETFGVIPNDVLKHRDDFRTSISHDLSISELHALPTFYGWVDCHIKGTPTNFRMYLAGADDGVAMRFFWAGRYEPLAMKLWVELAKNAPGHILDIGAHTGAYTLAAASVSRSSILSFEPHFMNFSRLNLNIRANGLPTNLLLWMALSDADEYIDFSVATTLDYLSSGGKLGTRGGALNYLVQARRLDSVLGPSDRGDVSMVKLDVEGSELRVLRGGRVTFESSKPVCLFECTDPVSAPAIEDELLSIGYQIYVVDESNDSLTSAPYLQPIYSDDGALDRSRINRLAVPSGAGWWDDTLKPWRSRC